MSSVSTPMSTTSSFLTCETSAPKRKSLGNTAAHQTTSLTEIDIALGEQTIMDAMDNPNTHGVVIIGSVAYHPSSTDSTNSRLCETLEREADKCHATITRDGITAFTTFTVVNGANYQGADATHGSTISSSNWVQTQVETATVNYTCFGAAPHSTDDMTAWWGEENGNARTTTLIIADSATERQEGLGRISVPAKLIVVTEGAGGAFNELYEMYKADPTIFTRGKVVAINNMFMMNVIIPSLLRTPGRYDVVKVREILEGLRACAWKAAAKC